MLTRWGQAVCSKRYPASCDNKRICLERAGEPKKCEISLRARTLARLGQVRRKLLLTRVSAIFLSFFDSLELQSGKAGKFTLRFAAALFALAE